MTDTSRPQLVGIFTTGRSGSSLLMRLLDGSAGLWVHPVEMNYLAVFSDLARHGRVRTQTLANATRDRSLALESPVASDLLVGQFRSHIDELRETYLSKLVTPRPMQGDPEAALKSRPRYAADEFLPALLAATRAASDDRALPAPPRYVFKTIETPYLEQYRRAFPGIKIIHLVRHPFASYASSKRGLALMRKRPFWYLGGDDLRTFLEMRWIPHAEAIVREAGRHPETDYLVRYEDLIQRPAEEMRRLCAWLGVPLPAEPTVQTVLGGSHMRELPVNASKAGVATPETVMANMQDAFGYEDVLTDRDKAFILLRTRALLRGLGYEAPLRAPGLGARLSLMRQWLLPDRWELMNVHSQVRLLAALAMRRCYIYSKLWGRG